MQINHKDLDKKNNHLDNLELVTGAENIRHSYANGRAKPWHKTSAWRGKPRISEATKDSVRFRRKSGESFKSISSNTGISITHIQRICAQRKEADGGPEA
jgi:hypothetical protein